MHSYQMARLGSKMKNYLVTGPPGIGKTTVLLDIKKELELREFKTGGCLTAEIREKERRIGFSIVNLGSGKEGILAHIESPSNKRVGRYGVNISTLETIGVTALQENLTIPVDVVIIDEIASMELFSTQFQKVVRDLLNSSKIVLGSIHYRSQHKFLQEVRRRKDVEIIEISRENRNVVRSSLLNKILRLLTP